MSYAFCFRCHRDARVICRKEHPRALLKFKTKELGEYHDLCEKADVLEDTIFFSQGNLSELYKKIKEVKATLLQEAGVNIFSEEVRRRKQ